MQYPIRILHVLARLDRGGAETMLMNLYRHIDRSLIQFDFVKHHKTKGAYEDEIIQLGGKVYCLPLYNGRNHFIYKRAWDKFFVTHPEYRIIHGHMRSTASIYLKIAKKKGLITIAHSHNTSSGKGISAVVKNIMQIPIKYTADYLFACSHDAGKWLFGKKAVKNRNFRIIKNAIEVEKFIYNEEVRQKYREQLGIQNCLVIGNVSRFSAQKNHDFLIDVFYEIQKMQNNAVLLLIGEGELRSQVEKKIHQLKIKNKVIITGCVENVHDYLQAMDVFVFPSLFEGLGIVLIEAQVSGLPCVVSEAVPDEAYVTELIHSCSLSESAKKWAEKALSFRDNIRKSYKTEVETHGYNIANQAGWLEKFYFEVSK